MGGIKKSAMPFLTERNTLLGLVSEVVLRPKPDLWPLSEADLVIRNPVTFSCEV